MMEESPSFFLFLVSKINNFFKQAAEIQYYFFSQQHDR
jgi:hypothetical protein